MYFFVLVCAFGELLEVSRVGEEISKLLEPRHLKVFRSCLVRNSIERPLAEASKARLNQHRREGREGEGREGW